MAKILIGVIAVAFIVIISFMVIDPQLQTSSVGTISEVLSENQMKITVEGEVYKTGTYTMQDNATMQDLIDAAGGLTASADERCFFETALLTKGVTYYIAPLYDADDICNTNEIAKVNVNSDDVTTLTSVNGITTSIASSIVSWRQSNGTFNTLEDLLDVYGIGTATYRKIRNYVILHE